MDISGPVVEVDVAGVRYEVLVPLFLWPELQGLAGDAELEAGTAPDIGLHIHYSASANQPVPVLVGFLRRAERDFFRKFITVEGVGPSKAARAMNVSVSTIARAIEQEDRAALTRLPGIGARGADKIIASLRGKVVAEASMHDGAIERPVDNVAWPDFFERQERIFFICLALVCQSLFGAHVEIIPAALWILALLTHATAVQRFLRAKALLQDDR